MSSRPRTSRRPSRRPAAKRTPYVAYGLGLLSLGLLVRGLWRPSRALVDAGTVSHCPSQPQASANMGYDQCSPSVSVDLTASSPVYALGAGKVVHVEERKAQPASMPGAAAAGAYVYFALSTEPVVLAIEVLGTVTGLPAAGAEFGIGQQMFRAEQGAQVRLEARELLPATSGTPARTRALDPLAWLVARGRTLTRSGNPASTCGLDGRSYRPAAPAADCPTLALPVASPYLILPVTVQQQPAKVT